jgi:hypothetical protein
VLVSCWKPPIAMRNAPSSASTKSERIAAVRGNYATAGVQAWIRLTRQRSLPRPAG